jgi:hypothetical protein
MSIPGSIFNTLSKTEISQQNDLQPSPIEWHNDADADHHLNE